MHDPTPLHDAVPADTWHGRGVDEWRARWGVPALWIFQSVGSTNDVARSMAEAGAPHGAVVLADVQARGRGRRGRAWRADPGQSLLLSMVLRPLPAAAAVLPLRIGLAVARAVEACAALAVRIKWPNDLLVGDRKLGGVLCEGAVEGAGPAWIVAGVGVNVGQRNDDWPAELRLTATSVAAAAGRAVEMPVLAGAVIAGISMAPRGAVLGPGELDELRDRDALRGRAVTVDGAPAGRAAGIDPEGALVVADRGRTRRVTAGTVRAVGPAAGDGATHETEP